MQASIFSEVEGPVGRPLEFEAMSWVQHARSLRRLKWATAAVALVAFSAAAEAQGFFFFFGDPSPYEIERQLAASGYTLNGPLIQRGDVYVADAMVRGEGPERLVIDVHSGRVLERYRGRGARWREAAAPPAGWSDDPSTWNGPRPPAAIAPDGGPPDMFAPRPNGLEPIKPKPKGAEVKPKPAATPKPAPSPVANVANPTPAAAASSPEATPPASPSSAAGAAPTAPTTPAPSLEAAAKGDAEGAAKPPPAGAGAPAPAKSNTVNDIPVTPLD